MKAVSRSRVGEEGEWSSEILQSGALPSPAVVPGHLLLFPVLGFGGLPLFSLLHHSTVASPELEKWGGCSSQSGGSEAPDSTEPCWRQSPEAVFPGKPDAASLWSKASFANGSGMHHLDLFMASRSGSWVVFLV